MSASSSAAFGARIRCVCATRALRPPCSACSGRRRTHANASSANSARNARPARRRLQLRLGVDRDDLGGLIGGQAGIRRRPPPPRGRDEVGALLGGGGDLLLHVVGKVRALEHRGAEVRRQHADDDRSDQRHAKRGAEVQRRPLQAAGLTAARRVDRRHDDVADLRSEQPQPRADQRHADGEARGGQIRSQEVEEHDLANEQRRQTAFHDQLGREASGQRRATEREQEQRDRERQYRLARLQRVEAEHGLQIERQHEERRLDDERLARLDDQARLHPRDTEQGHVQQRLVAALLDGRFAPREQRQKEAADDDQPQGRRQARAE